MNDATLNLCNVQPNMKVFTDLKKRRNGSALEEEGGEAGPCCVTLENHFPSLSLISFSEVEIMINIAIKCGLW